MITDLSPITELFDCSIILSISHYRFKNEYNTCPQFYIYSVSNGFVLFCFFIYEKQRIFFQYLIFLVKSSLVIRLNNFNVMVLVYPNIVKNNKLRNRCLYERSLYGERH